jgi:hypothetical protein
MSAASSLTRSTGRDLRLDFVRGLALFTVLVDHIIGDPIGHFTYHVLGFSDAAEIFVFVSGLTCGIVYYRVLCRGGWRSLFEALGQRAARIYVCYVLTSLAIVALVGVTRADINPALLAVASDPALGSWQVVVMHYSPPVSGILILYLPLTLIVIPLLFWAARRHPAIALAVSALVWVIAQRHPELGAVFTERTWFNVFAWQFLFVIGLVIGMQQSGGQQKPLFKQSRPVVTLAWVVVVSCFVYKLAIYFAPYISPQIGFDLALLRIPALTLEHMKETLASLRIVHFLGVALLFSTYVRRDNPLLESLAAKPLVLAGQNSLEMFSISAVLSMVANAYVLAQSPSVPARVGLDVVMAIAMALIAIVMAHSHRKRSALVGSQA